MWKAIAISTLVLAGCASHIETVNVDPKTLQATGPGIEGVIYYEPILVKITYVFTQRIEKDKGVVGSSDNGTCQPVIQKEELVTLPDYSKPKAILHKPAKFAASEFGVTLNNGMLVSVTSKSTPSGAPFLEQINKAKEVGILSFPGGKECNASPVIAKHERFHI